MRRAGVLCLPSPKGSRLGGCGASAPLRLALEMGYSPSEWLALAAAEWDGVPGFTCSTAGVPWSLRGLATVLTSKLR